jgi:dTDP-4-amino-4,6-dideoxygalactose transaminase|tara:strand:+ start:961 stop:2058 length:1098 start_codon:yes stop_codon:yes gene_type:complete
MKVELIDLRDRFKEEGKAIIKIVEKVLSKGNLILTKEVQNFEKSICKFTGAKFCLGLNSGTDALMMSLWSSGIKRGDEVITSPISFVATANSIIHVGAKPVFVDVGDDLNINPDLIEAVITKNTKAIMPVHWTGRVCEMDKIIKIAKKYKLKIIEDAAQATGAYYKGRHAGTFGKISAFSTHPLKNLNALGDGGFIITNEKKLYDKIKLYRSHGLEGRDDAKIIGVNSRLDSLNAEVLSFRLKKLKNIINRRKRNINYYKKYIKTDKVKILNDGKNEKNAYVMFVTLAENRNKLQEYLKKFNIQSLLYYPTPLHLHNSMKYLGYKKGSLINAERITSKVISFPHHQHLTEKQIKFVSEKINKFYL